jgi:hypothetical protein
MAGTLQGKRFFTETQKGVIAVISEEILRNRSKIEAILARLPEHWRKKNPAIWKKGPLAQQELADQARRGLKHIPTAPIFTFTQAQEGPSEPWFTGDSKLYAALMKHIRSEGGILESGSFYVPFISGHETARGSEHSIRARHGIRHELGYVSTEGQFQATFGIGVRELQTRYPV